MPKVTNETLFNKVEGLITPKARPRPSKKKILLVGAEVSPYAHVGGVSRVIAHLSQALNSLGHDARAFMPKFGSIDEGEYELEMICEGLKVPTSDKDTPYLICNVKKHQIPGHAPVYFLENKEYYELRANVYGYSDDPVRWALLSRGVLEFLRQCDEFEPDIIHANDWQAGLVPNYLNKEYSDDDILQGLPALFTIHNLAYQGMFDPHMVSDLDFDDGKSSVASLFEDRLLKQNFMRRGIMYADIINTVSPTYARQILKPEFGQGLDRLLTEVRSRVFGVMNGIDFDEYNPATDSLVTTNFDVQSLSSRVENKVALQKEFDLKVDQEIPIFGFVGRLTGQKGLDLLLNTIDPIMREFNVQFVFIGGGDSGIAHRIREVQERYPEMIGAHLMADFNLPRLLFAGADIIAVPSVFEPCGLTQLEGMRYGAIPLVFHTGGLADSVVNYDPDEDSGFGFVFHNYDVWSLFTQIVRAIETYRQKEVWTKLQRRAMMQDHSWENSAREYVDLYDKAIQLQKRDLAEKGKISTDSLFL